MSALLPFHVHNLITSVSESCFSWFPQAMTRRDISKEALEAKRSAIINQLQQLQQVLISTKTPNFGFDELCELGLKPVRVELAADKELLEFEPCFFLPQPTSVLLEHPVDPDDPEDAADSDLEHGFPYYYYSTEDSMEAADGLDRSRPGWYEHYENLLRHISFHVDEDRSGLPGPYGERSLRVLTPLQPVWVPDVHFNVYRPGDKLVWYTNPSYGVCFVTTAYLDKSAGTPHAIIELEVRYRGNDSSLTHGEVCGLLDRMCHWYSLREFRQHAMGPVSLRLFFTLLIPGSSNCTDRCWSYRICVPNMRGSFKLITMGKSWFCSTPL